MRTVEGNRKTETIKMGTFCIKYATFNDKRYVACFSPHIIIITVYKEVLIS